jgi:hypothetical protein
MQVVELLSWWLRHGQFRRSHNPTRKIPNPFRTEQSFRLLVVDAHYVAQVVKKHSVFLG